MQKLIDGLKNINVKARISEINGDLKAETNPRKIDALVKELKILRSLDEEGLTPEEAFTRKILPVIPSMYRTPAELANGTIRLPDVNLLIRDVGIANDVLRRAKENNLPEEDIDKAKKMLYYGLDQLSGFDPPSMNNKVTNNAFTSIAGKKSPKEGFVQSNLFRKRQDLSGRSTLTPNPGLGIDEVEIPKEIGYKIYEPFVAKELNSMGYSKSDIDKLVSEDSPTAFTALKKAGKERPVLINRAPSIRNTSVNALWPVFTDGRNIGVPNLLAGLNPSMDFDGDCVTVYIPITYVNPHLRIIYFIDKILSMINSCLRIIKGDNYEKASSYK